MATFISHNPAETDALAHVVAGWARPGLVLGLTGDLGSGKTHFVKGLARALGVTEPVLSPTFALLHVYTTGRMPLYHMDLYRLDSPEQVVAAGLHEYFTPDGITVVEWWDRWKGPQPSIFSELTFQVIDDSTRSVTYDPPGA